MRGSGLPPQALQPVWLDPGARARRPREPGIEAPQGYAFRKLRGLFGVLDDHGMAQAGRAYQIAEWARTHRYCGACGTPAERVAGEFCLRCPACGHSAYPRISPAMMVLVRHGDRILLARHAGRISAIYTALAGFVEPGESIEQTVHREVYEEVGLKVGNLRYFGSQSWPFPNSLMIAYTADYVRRDPRAGGRDPRGALVRSRRSHARDRRARVHRGRADSRPHAAGLGRLVAKRHFSRGIPLKGHFHSCPSYFY